MIASYQGLLRLLWAPVRTGQAEVRTPSTRTAVPALWTLDAEDEDSGATPRRSAGEAAREGAAALVCGACGQIVTFASERIEVLGSHEHRFMNPAGLLFHIGCFGWAPGCVVLGPASTEYPWFPGHAWRIALCAQCRAHLGWHFQPAGQGAFFGLRLDHLRAAEPPS